MDGELGINVNNPVLRKDRMSTGVPQLDLMLDGGYKNPSTVLMIGPSGPEKNVLAYHFVAAGIAAGDTVLYINTDHTPDEVEKGAGQWGVNIKGDNLLWLDCYSATVSQGAGSMKPGVKTISGPSALNELSLAIAEELEALAGKRLRVVFGSFSTFALYNPMESLFKFLSLVEGRLKKAGATTMLLVEEGMHEEKFLMTLKHNIDEEFIIKVSAEEKFLSGPQFPIDVPIRVGKLGVEVE